MLNSHKRRTVRSIHNTMPIGCWNLFAANYNGVILLHSYERKIPASLHHSCTTGHSYRACQQLKRHNALRHCPALAGWLPP